ncbi:MAG: 4'-phosphopantetheinyl transferase [Planctomycetota bacterium]|nr:MAG: 4'-phosphopantetheinyl transferase [Planctomycetota bacterium]
MLSEVPLAEAVAQLFDVPSVRVAVAPLDDPFDFAFPAEQAQVARAVTKRQREFATGRRLAHALLDELGAAPAALLSGPDRAPLWPHGIVGSICHSREWCVAALAHARDVHSLGVDHEPATPLESRLWRRILLPSEHAALERLPESERGLTAKLLFSAKECLYKAIAPQLHEFVGFLEVELTLQPDTRRFSAVILDPARAARLRGALQGRYLIRPEGIFTALVLGT